MGAQLQALLALQEIELQIVDIRRQLDRRQRLVGAQQKKLAALQNTLEAQRQEIRRSQAQFDDLDVDIKGRSANINRLREHLNTVRTNKDYAAVLARLNNEKADLGRLESRALELMQGIEARKRELAEQEQAVEVEARRLAELEAELEQARHSFAGRLEDLERRRRAAADEIDQNAVRLFERLSQHYDGEALAEVERAGPRQEEFVCAGCHMSLRAEVANTLKSRDELVTCKNCGRILFLPKET